MKILVKYFDLIVGIFLQAIGFNLFLAPNNLAATDVSGLGLIFEKLYHIDTFIIVLIINILLLFVSFVLLGKEKTIKTIVGSLLLPFALYITVPITSMFDVSEIDILVLAIFGGIFMGIGYGMIFRSGYTSGGTDIIEDILCKYFKISLAKSMIIVDGLVVLFGGLVFGIESMLYSIIALVTMSIFSNRKSIGVNEDKIVFIQTDKKELIVNYIKNNYHYGITILNGNGIYSKEEKDFIMCSISYNNYYKINEEIKRLVPDAFIIVVNSYETKYVNKNMRKKAFKN